MTPAAFVINRTRVRDVARFAERCRAYAALGGVEPFFLHTSVDEHGTRLARCAVRDGARLVVVAGGDGTVRLDGGEPLERRARSVVVGNVGLLPGGFVLLPDARPGDGLLDVGILAPSGLGDWGRAGYQVLAGGGRGGRLIETRQARRVEIRSDEPLPREVDGEIIAPGRSLTVAVRPGALLVRVPGRESAGRPSGRWLGRRAGP